MKIIGVAGQRRNGKDEIADHLASILNESESIRWHRTSFAKNVKKVFCETFNVDYDFVEKWKTESCPPPGFEKNIRESLQFIGDGFRKMQPNIWMDLVFKNLNKPIIISDCRYINEVNKIKSLDGICVFVWRSGFENNDLNESESQLRPMVDWVMENGEKPPYADSFDYIVKNNGTLEDLYAKIEDEIFPSIVKNIAVCENGSQI